MYVYLFIYYLITVYVSGNGENCNCGYSYWCVDGFSYFMYLDNELDSWIFGYSLYMLHNDLCHRSYTSGRLETWGMFNNSTTICSLSTFFMTDIVDEINIVIE